MSDKRTRVTLKSGATGFVLSPEEAHAHWSLFADPDKPLIDYKFGFWFLSDTFNRVCHVDEDPPGGEA